MAGPSLDPTLSVLDGVLWRRAVGAEAPDLAEALAEASSRLGGNNVALTVDTIIADGDNPLARIAPAASHDDIVFSGTTTLVRLTDDHGPFVLSAWPTAHPGVFHLAGSVPTTDPRWAKVGRWVANASPFVVPCLLDHDDFTAIAATLAEYGDVEVSRLSARRRSDRSSLTRGWPARPGTLRPTPADAIREAEDEGATVRTLTLNVVDQVVLHLRRLAGATYYSGDFGLFEAVVLNRLATAAWRRRALLVGRQRQLDEPPRLPILVRLPGPGLRTREATGELIDSLTEQSSISLAILHRNPYLHVAVTDHVDGSNFDVMVTDNQAIEVYSGFRASLGALARLTQRLADRFEAYDIVEAPPRPEVSLDDLLADV